MKPKLLRLPAALCAIITTAWSQNTPANADEIVTLSPFQVTSEGDTGYRAANTLDGSRLNTPLRDTPGAISVFTKDFLDDIGATDIRDILRYDVNTEEGHGDAESGGAGAEANSVSFGYSWRTRGIRTSTAVDGFRAGPGGGDTYNVDRVSSTRGPNAILFGTGAAGGMLSFRTKSANPARDTNTIEARIGEYDAHRATFDVNRALLKDRFAVRAMGLFDHRGSHLPYQFTRKKSATLAANYRVGNRTNLSASYEHSWTTAVMGRNWGPLDNVTKFLRALERGDVVWDAAQERYETRDGAAAGATVGVGTLSNRTVLVYGPETGTPVLWEGPSATANRATLVTNASQYTGAVVPIAPEWIAPLGEVTATGPGEYGTIEFHTFTATFTHELAKKLHVELAFNQSNRIGNGKLAGDPEIAADLTYRLPDGSLNPYFYGNGYYFMQTGSFLRQQTSNENLTGRASLSYELNLGKNWGTHRFAAMTERHIANFRRDRLREVWAGRPYGGNATVAQNQIARRRYIKIGSPWDYYTTGFPADPTSEESYVSAYPTIGTLTSGAVPANALDVDDETTTDSQLLVMQNYLFNRRVVTTVGLRYDTVNIFSPKTRLDPQTLAFRMATAADQPFFDATNTRWYDETEEKGWRRSVGAVWHATPLVSLTGNYSTGIELPDRSRTVLPNEEAPPPYEGDTIDVGLTVNLLQNRVTAAVKYFETQMIGDQGNAKVTTTFVQPNNDIMSSFEYYFRQAGITTFAAGDPIASIDELRSNYFSQAGAYRFDRITDGYELELVASPTENWTLRANYSISETTRTNVLSEGVPWWAERKALWQSLDEIYTRRSGRPSIFNQTYVNASNVLQTRTVNDRLADSDRELAAIRREEEHGYGNRKHKANLWARYRFTAGPLKNAALAAGWRYQGKNIAGVDLATGEPLHGNDRSLFDLMAQYRTKGLFGFFGEKTHVTYQLNITNVLDDDSLYISKIAVDDVTRERYIRRAFREDPRNASLTVRLDF